MKMRLALSIPTIASVGACMINRALCRLVTWATKPCSAMSSRNPLLIWKGRPASEISTLPCLRMSSMRSLNSPVTWAGSDGAPIVTTALASGICPAAARTAAPPRLWPIRIAGPFRSSRRWSAARTRSAIFDEKVEFAEIALAGAEAREVEPKHSDAFCHQARGDAPGGQAVLAASEAMREQRISQRLSVRQVQRCRELMAAFTFELETFGRHARSPW